MRMWSKICVITRTKDTFVNCISVRTQNSRESLNVLFVFRGRKPHSLQVFNPVLSLMLLPNSFMFMGFPSSTCPYFLVSLLSLPDYVIWAAAGRSPNSCMYAPDEALCSNAGIYGTGLQSLHRLVSQFK